MHRARKRFGQHFLHDQNVIESILRAINPQPGENLLEIGPGQGALTYPLLQRCGKLIAIELDRDLVPLLDRQAARFGELEIINTDILEFELASIPGNRTFRVVGNLPYNISTPLLFHLLSQSGSIQDMHFMLLKEVVDRMAASPGGSDYGRLSVVIQYHCQVQPLFRIGPGAFKPAPKVDSAFVRLTPWNTLPVTVDDYQQFENLVRQAFSQRRKTLRNTLKTLLDENAIRAAGVDPGIRPEHVTLAQYAALAEQL